MKHLLLFTVLTGFAGAACAQEVDSLTTITATPTDGGGYSTPMDAQDSDKVRWPDSSDAVTDMNLNSGISAGTSVDLHTLSAAPADTAPPADANRPAEESED